MDLVFFAGPVIIRPSFKEVRWRRPTTVIPIVGAGSAWFSQLAEQLRDARGRILPNLLARYAPGLKPERIALTAYSAGHGLLNKVFLVPEDLAAIDACILNDATFDAFGSKGKEGYVAFGIEAARGRKLMVSTTVNTTDGSYMSGRDSFRLVWDRVLGATGKGGVHEGAKEPMPIPSGGAFRVGDLHWYNYANAAGASDMTHGQQHDLAPATWAAYLAPYLGRSNFDFVEIAAGLALAAGGIYAAAHVLRSA